MHVAQQDPLLAWHQAGAHLAIRQTALFGAAEDESAGVARVVDNLPRPAVQQFGPNQFAFMRTAAQSAREQKFLRMELLDHRQTGSGPLKGLEEQTHHPLDLGIRIENDMIVRVMHKAYGYHLFELAAPGAA